MDILLVGIPPPPTEGTKFAPNLAATPSLFDFDALLVDPISICSQLGLRPGYERTPPRFEFEEHQRLFLAKLEESQYLLSKGGVIVTFLAPPTLVRHTNILPDISTMEETVSAYDWLPLPGLVSLIHSGRGERIRKTKTTAFDDYFKLKGEWIAYLTKPLALPAYETIATNDVGHAVAFRLRVGQGSIFFLPYSKDKEMLQVLLACIKKTFGRYTKRNAPGWVGNSPLPGEKELFEEIEDVKRESASLRSKEQSLNKRLYEQSLIKNLLYETGTALEDAVKAAFKELGYKLEKEGEKDLVSADNAPGRVVFEVTGMEKTIDVDKLRQLIDYASSEEKERGAAPKSILVGNHQIDIEPEKRGEPFTQRAVIQSQVYSTCLLPTPELYKAVVLFRTGKLAGKEFWDRLVKTTGVFRVDSG